ncbi:ABC transporter ATP-binding protein [Sulfurirhabdus autotrophica]|uniref:Amino acid/amide ABC transporter ATP-binding protein 2 (HAAT family) n=2 Tax=Sulfurirhabdus autotrophica TaxID=1706046 RepID=A0A4R3XRI1_9PROT|nr:ABC transporter ATP-binding protein [Sulfurirhabdus autotrophica]TCV80266.1 amino acid/amide ABC transporter ATP-binding protein 2 (HAAT family) [Sulfurirhabdus autotrophica]
MSLLKIHDLKVAYGGIHAVKGIDIEIEAGELVCLIGANGAGKTTTLKALCGMLPVSKGTVHYEGRSIAGMQTHEIVRQGISLVPEGRGVFSRLTVAENLEMGAYIRNDKSEIRGDMDQMYALFPRLHERRTQQAGTLSGGEQQLLAMGRALMSRPKLLFLDEPSMGLAPLMVQKIFETVRNIAAQGVTIFLVEQNAKLALEISHRGYVMESGLITLKGEAQSLLKNPLVQQAYLGE